MTKFKEGIYFREYEGYYIVKQVGDSFEFYHALTRHWSFTSKKPPKGEEWTYIDPDSFDYSSYLQAQIDHLTNFIETRLK